jgi:adenine-specific DNA-methyltransferase
VPPSKPAKATKAAPAKSVEALKHPEARRKNIPTAEYEPVLKPADQAPIRVAYDRRNRDLDPQLVWRGKDEQDWSDLVVHAPPLYIQEKVHPKALIDDLLRTTKERQHEAGQLTADLFSDFNGIPKGVDKTEFYQHDQNWSNRMILGDSLQVMASLAEREGLRGKIQCIYVDPPYGINFRSNFQWSTTTRDVKDKPEHVTREPEQVRAFRDTWRDGINSYLTYLRDRLTVARDLLAASGSIFVQIGDENVHRVRALLDELFGEKCFLSQIVVVKTAGLSAADRLAASCDLILWYCKEVQGNKYRQLTIPRRADANDNFYRLFRDPQGRDYSSEEEVVAAGLNIDEVSRFGIDNLTKPGPGSKYDFAYQGESYSSGARWWGTPKEGMSRLSRASRLKVSGNTLRYVKFVDDYPVRALNNVWSDMGTGGFLEEKVYVVQTRQSIVERCVLMTTDPGDLVLDPTCGSGTTAYVAEQWGRRWITIDTSRVALALARARIMGARYAYYLLSDSREGQLKEGELGRTSPRFHPVGGNIRFGFVYSRVPHISPSTIGNNLEIDTIWDEWHSTLEPLRKELNAVLKQNWREWEVPRSLSTSWPVRAKQLHADYWASRLARQQAIDRSIAAKAEFENLYDRPYEDKKKVRVAGPFTVESLSPHRVLGVDEKDELIDPLARTKDEHVEAQSFPQMILENLRTAGVQQAHKTDKIAFTSLTPWPGTWVCGEGRYLEKDVTRRAAIFIGPEFGTVQRADLVEAAREAGDGGFDVLIACAFNYEAHTTEFDKLGRIPVLKARMNAELHMSADLKNTGKGNLFVVFGEPDIDVLSDKSAMLRVKVKGVDVFEPGTGEVRSDGPDGIACWFIDTDYNAESFFVRHAYFLGANDPYSALKTTLKAEVDKGAWESLHSDTSRPFPKPKSGRIAVKVINHLGDEVMKVFKVGA